VDIRLMTIYGLIHYQFLEFEDHYERVVVADEKVKRRHSNVSMK